LKTPMPNMLSTDFFTVPTATFRVLFVLVILSHSRRRDLHFNVTSNPSAEWTSQQLVEAFPWDTTPEYLLRDRDSTYGAFFSQRAANMSIREVITARQSPLQNAFVERLIGSVRRDCLDHVIVLNESHLKRILSSYFDYYDQDRTHYSLAKDTPFERTVQSKPGQRSKVIELPRVGGLHHRYEWKRLRKGAVPTLLSPQSGTYTPALLDVLSDRAHSREIDDIFFLEVVDGKK